MQVGDRKPMMADTQSRKPIPTGGQQIEHLKQRGVFFVLYTEMEAARIVFGAEPSDEEILQFVRSKWAKLAFFGDDPTERSKPAKNPKRRAREVSKALKQPAMGTKAQQALASQRETMKRESVRARSQRRADEAEARFEQRKLSRKQKHRGH